jgi:hypothetical protein
MTGPRPKPLPVLSPTGGLRQNDDAYVEREMQRYEEPTQEAEFLPVPRADDGRDTYDPSDALCLRLSSSTPRSWEEHPNPLYGGEW